MKWDENQKKLTEIIVLSSHELQMDFKNRIARTIKKNFDSTPKVTHEIDKSLKGGVIINLGKSVIDGSLITRWRIMWSHLLGRP